MERQHVRNIMKYFVLYEAPIRRYDSIGWYLLTARTGLDIWQPSMYVFGLPQGVQVAIE